MDEACLLFFHATDTEEINAKIKIEQALQDIGYFVDDEDEDEDTLLPSYCLLRGKRERVEERVGRRITIAELMGCSHPSPESCSLCMDLDYADPFIDRHLFEQQRGELLRTSVSTAQEAMDCYTYFNMIWDWRQRRSRHEYFAEQYPLLRDAMSELQLRYEYDRDRQEWIVKSDAIQQPPRYRRSNAAPLVTPKPYCSALYSPTGNSGVHCLDATLPRDTEITTYLTCMLEPPRQLAIQLLRSDILKRSISEGTIPRPTSDALLGKKRTPSFPGGSSRMIAIRRTVNLRGRPRHLNSAEGSPKRYNPLVKTVTIANADQRRRDTNRQLATADVDPREERANRLKKYQELSAMFQRGFPRLVLHTEGSAALERRTDYRVKADPQFCNVFVLSLPTAASPASIREEEEEEEEEDSGPW